MLINDPELFPRPFIEFFLYTSRQNGVYIDVSTVTLLILDSVSDDGRGLWGFVRVIYVVDDGNDDKIHNAY